LSTPGRWIPAVDRHKLLDTIHKHICIAAQGVRAANQPHLIAFERHGQRGGFGLGEPHRSEEK